MKEIDDKAASFLASLLGARGGSAKTPKKVRASRRNVQKAIAARMAKFKAQEK